MQSIFSSDKYKLYNKFTSSFPNIIVQKERNLIFIGHSEIIHSI